MSGSSTSQINILLKKTSHYDKDERYMATSDLCDLLKRAAPTSDAAAGSGTATGVIRLDPAVESQICKEVLRLLDDKSHDVQAVAVKTLGVLLTCCKEQQVLEIAGSLVQHVQDVHKSELRDVYAIGLRTLVKTIPASMGHKVADGLLSRLLEGVRSTSDEIVLACLDVLTDLLSRFGATAATVIRQHEPVLLMCLELLSCQSSGVIRKRAGNTLAVLSTVLSDVLLQRMVDAVLCKMDAPSADTPALIRTMCAVSAVVGHRLGQAQIDRILPIFLSFCQPKDAVTGDDNDGDDDDMEVSDVPIELRESCFMGFESFVLRCPVEVEPHLESITKSILAYMKYDPNYSYGSPDDDDDDEEDDPIDEDEEYEEDDEYEDDDDDEDDDESWKVRRSAIRAMKAVVESKQHDPSSLWTTDYNVRLEKVEKVSKVMVLRFCEREENCRVGVIDCFTRLLQVTVSAANTGKLSFASEMDDVASATIDLQSYYAPAVVKACEKILATKKGNDRSKSAALSLLSALCIVPGGVGGEAEISSVFRHLKTFIKTDNDSMRDGASRGLRLEAVALVHKMLSTDTHRAVHVRICLIRDILEELCEVAGEQWYKVVAEALRALSKVPAFFIAGYLETDSNDTKTAQRKEVAGKLFSAIEPLLAAHDVDQEIKECALKACSALMISLHSFLEIEQSSRLQALLLERLKNETTRIVAIKTLTSIAQQQDCNLKTILSDSVATLASFLQLSNRGLKQHSLEALGMLLTYHGQTLSDEALYSNVIKDLGPLVTDRDLHLSHLSLRVAVSILRVSPSSGPSIKQHVLDPALALSTSTLVQDSSLDSLLNFFKQIVISEAIGFRDLLGKLQKQLTESTSKQGTYCLAKCIAVSMATTSNDNSSVVLDDLFALIDGSVTPDEPSKVRHVQLALLITGDLGRLVDLSAREGVADRLISIYAGYFESSSEDLKNAASYALGNASVGSPAMFLQAIVSNLDNGNKKHKYLLLSALREFIQCSSESRAGTSKGITSESLGMILKPLETNCSDNSDGVRTMVSECMGSLTCLEPNVLLAKLVDLQKNHFAIEAPDGTIADGDTVSKKNANVCWTVASSVKLAISGKVDSATLALRMPLFISLLEQKELHVRTATLLMIYSAVHHMPNVVLDLLGDPIIPSLYEVSSLKLERKVNLGPFTHTVDDALPLRKAALSIFATCLDNIPGSLDTSQFMPVLATALGDKEDIQLHAHQILISMCTRQPNSISASVDLFVEPLEKTMSKKSGQKTGTELERLNDWIKSALRVMLTLNKLEGASGNRSFAEFVERIKGNAKFTTMLGSLDSEFSK